MSRLWNKVQQCIAVKTWWKARTEE